MIGNREGSSESAEKSCDTTTVKYYFYLFFSVILL